MIDIKTLTPEELLIADIFGTKSREEIDTELSRRRLYRRRNQHRPNPDIQPSKTA
jgi:hypothetical protein